VSTKIKYLGIGLKMILCRIFQSNRAKRAECMCQIRVGCCRMLIQVRRDVGYVVLSRIMYEGPVWGERVLINRSICRKMERIFRIIILRVITVY